MKRELTALGGQVSEFIARTSESGTDREIGLLLLKLLLDERAARQFGLMKLHKRGRRASNGGKHVVIAAEYLIELHLCGSAKTATETVCDRHRIDERQLRRYRKSHELSAYVLYRLAVLNGEFGLTGEPNIPAEVDTELQRIAAMLRGQKFGPNCCP